VFKLIKLMIGVVGLGAFCWLGATVPLGDHTLFGHLSAIGKSRELQDLMRGTKEKVGDLKKRIAGSESKSENSKSQKPSEVAAPHEQLTHVDRKEIRHFIDTARSKIAKSN